MNPHPSRAIVIPSVAGLLRWFVAVLLLAANAVMAAPAPTAAAASVKRAVEQTPLTFGLVANDSEQSVLDRWRPFVEALSQQLQRPVNLVASKDHFYIVNAIERGAIQLAWLSNLAAIEVVESRHMSVFAQMVRRDGSLTYRSLLLVPKASPIREVRDLIAYPGRYRYATGYPESLTGYIVPRYYLFHRNHIDSRNHFSGTLYGSHFDSFIALAEGRADVASSSSEEFARYQNQMPDKFAAMRVLWESPPLPNDPVLYRNDLSADLKKQIREFFLGYGRTLAERERLGEMNGLSGFKISSNYQLRPIVDLDLFEMMMRGMIEKANSPDRFAELRERLTERASTLDVLLNASRF
ncbi:MAG: phosphate/phosphite/phosphonate ABC transporter substrate-binding protein [Burkholderiaceae bacterium]